MKTPSILFLFLFIVVSANAQTEKSDPVKTKQDSLAKAKKDSAQIANSSPMRVNNSATKKAELNLPPAKRQRSQYTYDKEGRITGGSTTIMESKPKKKKKN
jgi:hypothetical protein